MLVGYTRSTILPSLDFIWLGLQQHCISLVKILKKIKLLKKCLKFYEFVDLIQCCNNYCSWRCNNSQWSNSIRHFVVYLNIIFTAWWKSKEKYVTLSVHLLFFPINRFLNAKLAAVLLDLTLSDLADFWKKIETFSLDPFERFFKI